MPSGIGRPGNGSDRGVAAQPVFLENRKHPGQDQHLQEPSLPPLHAVFRQGEAPWSRFSPGTVTLWGSPYACLCLLRSRRGQSGSHALRRAEADYGESAPWRLAIP